MIINTDHLIIDRLFPRCEGCACTCNGVASELMSSGGILVGDLVNGGRSDAGIILHAGDIYTVESNLSRLDWNSAQRSKSENSRTCVHIPNLTQSIECRGVDGRSCETL